MRLAVCSLVVSCLLFGGCTHSVHQASIGGLDAVPPGAKLRFIEAEAEEFVFLGIGGETTYVDAAWRKLEAQCKHGEVVAVESRHSTSLNFLSYTDKVRMTGLCLDGGRDRMATLPTPKQPVPSKPAAPEPALPPAADYEGPADGIVTPE